MLESLAHHYPEKTFYLGQAFNDTANSYKLVWFLSILSLLRRGGDRAFLLADIFTEMAAVAWHPVCLFRLSLGRQDKLQDAILEIQRQSRLAPNAPFKAVRHFVDGSPEAKARLDYFKRYVPTRFLAPWFADRLRGEKDFRRDRQIEVFAKESQATPFASLYWFDAGSIRLNDSWRLFLMENMAVVQAFAERHLAHYLQARNPNVPGIVNKLRAPTHRELTAARQFWRWVRTDFERTGEPERFLDIYSGRPLDGRFAIDHFLPWSFVAHDLLWNLTPVEITTNSKKGDVLPDVGLYLPRLVKLHLGAIEAARKRPELLEDYTDCFKLDVEGLLDIGENALVAKYREVIAPQAQIAVNQGFQSGWRLHSPAVFVRTEREPVSGEVPRHQGRLAVDRGASEAVLAELFPEQARQKPSPDHLPYYSLAIAAGGFLAGDAPEAEGWVDVVKHGFSKRISDGMFVTRVVGKSMEPTIKDGSYCVFRGGVTGTRQGLVVLVDKLESTDPETGGNYTVKRYRSAKSATEDGWRHESIRLIPDNPNRDKFPVLEFSREDEADLRVVAEFVEMLSPAM
jgi:hypothetical protein